jgi:hypothetical protein
VRASIATPSSRRHLSRKTLQSILRLGILRLVLVCHALAIFAESVFAGEFLSGVDGPVKFHELTGWIVLALSTIQIIVTAAFMRAGLTSLWLVFGSILVFLGEALQIGTGYGRFLNVHVPLGVVVFGAVGWQAIAVFLKQSPSGGTRQ